MTANAQLNNKWAFKFPDPKSIQNSLRKFGSFMAGMIMPVIGLIIAWGFFTAIVLGVKTGIMQSNGIETWGIDPTDPEGKRVIDHSKIYLWNMDWIISWGISSVIPLMVGFFGGKQIYDMKGAVIGVIATMGVIGGSYSPLFNEVMVSITNEPSLYTSAPPVMILGAMIAGPVAAILFKKMEKLWVNHIPSGFEMLIGNLSIGLIGLIFMFASFWSLALLAAVLQSIFYLIINGLNNNGLLWLMPIFIETEKILFLNNAVNHGILGPLGLNEVQTAGQSALFYLDPNPGTGMGLLVAYALFGKKDEKTQSAAAMPVHFIGGIHEVYYPFVLVKPLNLLWLICGGVFAALMYQVFDVGGIFTPSPGSIIMNYLSLNPKPMNYAGLTVAIFGSLAITGVLTSAMLITERLARNEKVYFNPVTAMLMAKVNRLMNVKDAISINKNTPIKEISYATVKTNKQYEWELLNYVDGSKEDFINSNKDKKIKNFWYVELTKEQLQTLKTQIKDNKITKASFEPKAVVGEKANKYFVREFVNGKYKIVKMRKTDKPLASVKYEERTFEDRTRTITFKPVQNKKGKVKQPKPLVQKVWYLDKEEKLADLVQKADVKKTTINLSAEQDKILKETSKIIFACEAGMGSSAMGAGIVRKLLKEEKINGITVVNFAIKDLPPNAQVVICQNIFKDIVSKKLPNAYVYTIDQFLKKSEYDNLINKLIVLRKDKA